MVLHLVLVQLATINGKLLFYVLYVEASDKTLEAGVQLYFDSYNCAT